MTDKSPDNPEDKQLNNSDSPDLMDMIAKHNRAILERTGVTPVPTAPKPIDVRSFVDKYANPFSAHSNAAAASDDPVIKTPTSYSVKR